MIKTKEHCDICNRDFTNLERHTTTKTKHGVKYPINSESFAGQESDEILPEPEITPNKRMQIAHIIHNDILVPICRKYNLELVEWEWVDLTDYLAIADKINSIT